MQTTMELLSRATQLQPSDAEWCRTLGVSRTTLAVARTRGHLTPVVAGGIAQELDLDPILWIARAALEAAPPSKIKTLLSRPLEANSAALYLDASFTGPTRTTEKRRGKTKCNHSLGNRLSNTKHRANRFNRVSTLYE